MSDLPFDVAEQPTARTVVTVTERKCRRHRWTHGWDYSTGGAGVPRDICLHCHRYRDEALSRRGKNNRKRGNAAELVVARAIGGEKVGPLGHPWDVTIPGYARLQVKKTASPPSLRRIAEMCRAIAVTPGVEMPGVVWLEPGRNGERLIVFRLREFTEHHGEMRVEE